MVMLKDKALQSQAIEKHFNNQHATSFSMTERLIELVGISKVLSKYNKSRMDLFKILVFLISTIGVVTGGSLNQLFSKPAIADSAGFCKSTLYNALKHQGIDWSGLFGFIAIKIVELFFRGKEVWFVADDSIILRDSSKFVDLLTRVFDHNSKTYHKGFTLLVLGITDGHCMLPVSFTLLASSNPKSLIKPKEIDKKRKLSSVNAKTKAGKNRTKACQQKMNVLIEMLKSTKSTLSKKLIIKGLLIDSWFSAPAQIQRFLDIGLDVITQVKFNNTKYKTEDGRVITVKSEASKISRAIKQGNYFGSIAEEILVECTNCKGKIIFARNWTENSENKPYIALFCTKTEYSGLNIKSIYKYRWEIETMFKRLKSLLDIQKGNTTRIFESNVACISIAFIRYLMIMLVQRQLNSKNNRPRLSFDQVKCMFADEKQYTEFIKDFELSLSSQTQFKDYCIDSINFIIQNSHTMEEFHAAMAQFKKDLVKKYQENVFRQFNETSPETSKRLSNYILYGNIVCEDVF